MAPFSRRKVTTEAARELDRAMLLLQRGRISYGRWVETLAAWCAGENIRKLDYGNAESVPERIVARYRGEEVSPELIAADFGISYDSAYHALHRLSSRRLALRTDRGRYQVMP